MPKMDKTEWTVPSTQTLIEMYEQFPCLYNPKHKLYHNKHARTDALYKICEVLKEDMTGVTVEEIKKKITNLRSQYAHECAKMKKVTHSGMSEDELYEPSVWWFSQMQFLNEHIKARKGKSSFEAIESQQINSQEDETSSSDLPQTHVPEVPMEPVKKKQKLSTTSIDDKIVTQTVQTLHQLQQKLDEPQTISVHQPFGDYIVAELNTIDDEEIIADIKHEINNILYKGKKQFIVKHKAGVVIEDML